MSMRVIVAIAIAAMIAFAFAAWNISTQMTPPPAPTASSGGGEPATPSPAPAEAAAPEAADPGVAWDVPRRWTIDMAGGMRVATYLIASSAAGQGAECAVYYFGPGQGGGVEANLQRWMSEFQPLEKHDVRKLKPGGIDVTRIEARGTYVAHSMRGGDSSGVKANEALIGAIVSGPRGDVFFKLTGPAGTVDAAAREFDGMLGSMKKK
jgi:hypothetical protein